MSVSVIWRLGLLLAAWIAVTATAEVIDGLTGYPKLVESASIPHDAMVGIGCVLIWEMSGTVLRGLSPRRGSEGREA